MNDEIIIYILGYLLVSGICSLIYMGTFDVIEDVSLKAWFKLFGWLMGLPIFVGCLIFVLFYCLFVLFVRPIIILIKKLKRDRGLINGNI